MAINHIPTGVVDLERTVRSYRALGFALKPGHLHADGIRNAHLKFADGAGLEFLSAVTPTDALAHHYHDWAATAEGPAYVGLHVDTLAPVLSAGRALHLAGTTQEGLFQFSDPALNWLFLTEGTNLSPSDTPEYFAHPNTAYATLAVWLAPDDRSASLALFKALGATIVNTSALVPEPSPVTVVHLGKGDLVFLPRARQLLPGRPIVGVVFAVRSLAAADRALGPQILRRTRRQTGRYGACRVLGPELTHGLWLELCQPPVAAHD